MSRNARAATELLERVGIFARQRVAPAAGARDRAARFDRALWRELAATGLLGAQLPVSEGGLGLDFGAVAEALFTLAREGGDLSLCVSLTPALSIIHLELWRLGTPDQRRRFLPALLSGERVPAVAFSEIPHGANPKHLAARAVRENDTWTLDGRKAFVTNGTEADLYLLLAVTSEEGARKGFSTFLVERETPGVKVEERMAIDFVPAAPHAVVAFAGCRVPEANRLGTLHAAHDESSRVFRQGEDAIGASTLAGHSARIVKLCAAHARDAVAEDPEKAAALGELQVLAAEARVQAGEAARLWQGQLEGNTRGAPTEAGDLQSALLAGRLVTARFSERLAFLLEKSPPEAESDLARALRDLALARIGAGAAKRQLRRLGEKLAGAGSP